ncbi:MAG: enoyl-CoA hydratase/isomerase family protein [bacterium]|nr:enoyl-CoA hydratase/isomerase family protein [bacterium]
MKSIQRSNAMISVEKQDKIAIIRFTRSVTNPMNLEFVNSLHSEIENLENDPSIRGLVITSGNDKFFSIGFDIPELISLNEEEFGVFYRSVNKTCLKLFTMPKPAIAAVNGHAVAGGCVIALCCDHRFIAEGRTKMGLNEIKLGVTVPYPVDCILRDIAGTKVAMDVMETGEFFDPNALLRLKMVDRIIPQVDLLRESVEKVSVFGEMPPEAFAAIKRNRTEPIMKMMKENLEEREELFIKLWFSDTARENLRNAMENF